MPIKWDMYSEWVHTVGVPILVTIIIAVLSIRAGALVASVVQDRYNVRRYRATTGQAVESLKYRRALAQVAQWIATVVIVIAAVYHIVGLLGISLAGFIAPAAVIGVALGFGAQRIMQDILAGFFIIAERQYSAGDNITIAALGDTSGITGEVEVLTLRITRLRTSSGDLVTVPNGQISQVSNLSRGWAKAVVGFSVPATTNPKDVEKAVAGLDSTAQLTTGQSLAELTIAPVVFDGITSLEGTAQIMQVSARVHPGGQAAAQKAIRERLVKELASRGIPLAEVPA